jgi:hypothetical protein
MSVIDTAVTEQVLRAFQSAWSKSIADYALRRLNAEHTLQSALYHHLRCELPADFNIYTEAVIRLSESAVEEAEKRKVVVDLLICDGTVIVAAIEIKFTPRGMPTIASLKKDVSSLSCISNRRNLEHRVSIEMPRFRSRDSDSLRLSILTHRKLIIAAYFDGREASALSSDSFWAEVKPDSGYWKDSAERPKNLGVALARTDDSGQATAHFFGGPFERLAGNV